MDQPRDARNYPLYGFDDLSHEEPFLFLVCLSTGQDFVSNRGKNFTLVVFTIFISIPLEENGRESEIKFHIIRNFPSRSLAASIPTLLVRRSIVHDDGRLFALRLFCDSYNKRSGTTIDVRSCEARSPREILLVLDRVTVRTKTCSLRQEPRRDVLRRDSPLKNDVSLCSSSSSRSLVKP